VCLNERNESSRASTKWGQWLEKFRTLKWQEIGLELELYK